MQGKHRAAELLNERAISIWKTCFGQDHPKVFTGVMTRGRLLLGEVRTIFVQTSFFGYILSLQLYWDGV